MNKRLVVGDIIVIVILLFLPIKYFVVTYLSTNFSKQVAISTNNKEELFSIDIDTEVVRNNVRIKISSKKVLVIEASCQNKICIKTGPIKNPGQMIVCAPNKVVIKILSNKKKFDSLGY